MRTAASLLLLVLASGCVSPPRPVDELFQEALEVSHARREALARATAAQRAARACPPPPADLPPPPDASPRVSDVLVETDLREAIAALAAQAGLQVAVDLGVEGTVTARLDRVPFETALASLLPIGVTWGRVGGGYVVALEDPQSPTFAAISRTELYRPRHLGAAQLLALLPPHCARFARVSAERNLLALSGPPATLRRVLRELGALDAPVPQVEIEAIVCELAPYHRLETGFDFEHGVPLPGGDKAGLLRFQDLAGSGAIAPMGELGTKSFEFYSAFVRLLATEGYVAIRAAPRLRVEDGAPAKILIGEQTYFTVSQGREFFRELRTIDTGIVLELSARILGGGAVGIKVDRAEVSDSIRPTSLVPGPDGALPTVSTRRVQTTVTIADGETVVIGGLVRKRTVARSAGVPVLSDIPILGELFRRRDEREEEAEVAIFITARVVE